MANLYIVKVLTRYNDGYAAAVHGEPLDDRMMFQAVDGYRAACRDIMEWLHDREVDDPYPDYVNPELVANPFEGYDHGGYDYE